jgi:uncharacterized membrane protein
MRNTVWWTEALQLVLIAAMFLAAALTWPVAPDQIPVHWGVSGQVDRYGGKVEGLLGPPLLALAVYFAMRLLPRFDPGRPNYAQFAQVYAAIRVVIVAAFAAIYGLVVLSVRGLALDMPMLGAIAVGILLVVVGNFMGKVRPNWFVGIRTPWTLSSKAAWTRTHRLGGWLLIADGIALIAVGALRAEWALGAWIALTVGSMLWLVVYSYRVWQADPQKIPPAGTLPVDREQ